MHEDRKHVRQRIPVHKLHGSHHASELLALAASAVPSAEYNFDGTDGAVENWILALRQPLSAGNEMNASNGVRGSRRICLQ